MTTETVPVPSATPAVASASLGAGSRFPFGILIAFILGTALGLIGGAFLGPLAERWTGGGAIAPEARAPGSRGPATPSPGDERAEGQPTADAPVGGATPPVNPAPAAPANPAAPATPAPGGK